MGKTKNTDMPTPDAELLIHSRWVIGQYEITNEAIMSRAASLLGFVGIEIAVLVDPRISISNEIQTAAVFALVLAVFILVWVLWPRNYGFPDGQTLRNAYSSRKTTRMHNLAEQILTTKTPENSPVDQLALIISARGKLVRAALFVIASAQLLIFLQLLDWR